MNLDRTLVEKIKGHISQYTAEQIQEIVDSQEQGRWSAEAIEAAREVLHDRKAGLTFESFDSEHAEEEPAATTHTTDGLGWLVAMNAIALPFGFVVLPINRHVEDDPIARDHPVPFGPESAWLALDTTDTAAVAKALGLRGVRTASWAYGVAAAARSAVFVTPPLGEWTLVVSASLFPPPRVGEFVTILLEGLGRRFADAQYFCTSANADLHAWARARNARLVRGHGRSGTGAQWDVGEPTEEERELGLFETPNEDEGEQTLTDEDRVLSLAAFWSVDPSSLNEHFKEPVMGLVGDAAWGG